MQQGRFTEAEAALKGALGESPSNVTLLSLLGVVLDQQQRYADAEPYYKQAITLAPASASVLNNFGSHCLLLGRPDEAEGYFRKALVADPNHANANLQMARLDVDRHMGKQALLHLAKLPPNAAGGPDVRLLRVRALRWSGRQAEALPLVRRLRATLGEKPAFQFALGLALAELGQFHDAEQMFIRVLRSDPTDFLALYNLGLAAERGGQFDRARQAWETAVRVRPDDRDLRSHLAQATGASGSQAAGRTPPPQSIDAESRLKELDQAAALRRGADYFVQRAGLLDELGRVDEACNALASARKQGMDSARNYIDAARLYARYERLKEAGELLAEGVARFPNERDLLLMQATLLELDDKTREAMDALKRIRERWPECGRVYLLLGVVLEEHENPDLAKPYLEMAIKLGERGSEAYYRLAETIWRANPDDSEKAAAAVYKALELDPMNPSSLLLAGGIEVERAEYEKAAGHLVDAVRLAPQTSRAHYLLSQAYSGLGQRETAAAEAKLFERMKLRENSEKRRPPEGASLKPRPDPALPRPKEFK
jgi:tetratricopeptide (TPR) repeat protein